MIENIQRELLAEAPQHFGPELADTAEGNSELAVHAQTWAHALAWLPGVKESNYFAKRVEAVNRRVDALLMTAESDLPAGTVLPEDQQWLRDNGRLIRLAQQEIRHAIASLHRVPHVRTPDRAT